MKLMMQLFLALTIAVAAVSFAGAAPTDECATRKAEAGDLVEVAAGAGSFRTLLAAAKAAGLVDALKGDGPLTVFAPTDAAFAKIPRHTLQALLKPENRDKLAKILAYHVVPGRLDAEDVTALNGAKTLQGGRLRFQTGGGSVHINNARVVKADVSARNGVIHVIDTVLMPE